MYINHPLIKTLNVQLDDLIKQIVVKDKVNLTIPNNVLPSPWTDKLGLPFLKMVKQNGILYLLQIVLRYFEALKKGEWSYISNINHEFVQLTIPTTLQEHQTIIGLWQVIGVQQA